MVLNCKSKRTKHIEVFSKRTTDSNNFRCETLYVLDYEDVNIFSQLCCVRYKVMCGSRRRLKHRSFKFIQSKAENWYKIAIF